ncbi:hypothetical protein ACYOEI_29480 [Singulisphaera rosea]
MGTTERTKTSELAMAATASARIERNLDMTPEAERFLSSLSQRIGKSEGDVIRLALGMLKTAIDAKDAGQHVGVAASSDSLDIELVGF